MGTLFVGVLLGVALTLLVVAIRGYRLIDDPVKRERSVDLNETTVRIPLIDPPFQPKYGVVLPTGESGPKLVRPYADPKNRRFGWLVEAPKEAVLPVWTPPEQMEQKESGRVNDPPPVAQLSQFTTAA